MADVKKAARPREVIHGPGKVPIQLNVNGRIYNLNVEPRRTLLDALRVDLHLTGSKRSATWVSVGLVRSWSMAGPPIPA